MAIGDIIVSRVERIAAGGAGVAHEAGQTVFIDFTAPGDLVSARIIEEREGFLKARPIEVVETSPNRIEPVCPLYGQCGGCSLQHLSYEAQLVAKEAILRDAFSRIASFKCIPEPRVRPQNAYGYRNRMQFHRVERPRPPAPIVGLKRREGEEVLPVADCPIADDGIREALNERTISPPPGTNRFTVFSRGETFLCEGKTERGSVNILGRGIRMDVRGFFQSNAPALEALIADLLSAAEEAEADSWAADLYCGVGTFGVFLAERFSHIDLLERNRTALALAKENVRGKNVRYFAQSDDEWAKSSGRDGKGPYGFAVVDPPRVGLSGPFRRHIGRIKPRILAYVSCDPATLARDAKDIVAAGYELESISYYDFYPQTPHIESLAVFRSV